MYELIITSVSQDPYEQGTYPTTMVYRYEFETAGDVNDVIQFAKNTALEGGSMSNDEPK